jgi:serine protease Do
VVGDTKPGSTATVQVWRKGSARDLTVTVTDTESTQAASKKPDAPVANANSVSIFGVAVVDLSDAKKKDLNIKGGVEVTSLGDGPLAKAGVRPGDVIIRIETLVKGLDTNKAVPVFIRRSDSTLIIPVRPK